MQIIIILCVVYVIFLLISGYLKTYQPDVYITLSKRLHLPSQILPPFVILFFFNTNGPALWFSMAFLVYILMFSVCSFLIKLFTYKKNKAFLIRPLLSMVLISVIFGFAHYTVDVAKAQVFELAHTIQTECVDHGECPSTLSGWEETDESSTTNMGGWVKYPVIYINKGAAFELHLNHAVDTRVAYTAGVNKPVGILTADNNN